MIDTKMIDLRNVTTEQLGALALQSVKEMSPEEKAEVRKHLDKEFNQQKSPQKTS